MSQILSMIYQWDTEILRWIQDHLVAPTLTTIMTIFTTAGNEGMLWIAVALILFIPKKTRPWALGIGIALLLGLLSGNIIIKNLVARLRPFQQLPFALLIPPPSGYSFPSGHTLSSFAAATVLFCYNKKAGIASYFVAFLIGFSRLYFAVHFPSDVFAGLLLGLLCGWVGYRISKKLYPWLKEKFANLKKNKV